MEQTTSQTRMAGLTRWLVPLAALTAFARSPKGQRMIGQATQKAQQMSKDPKTRAKIQELTIRGHETALKQNNRWLDAMMDADEDGRDQRDFLRTPDRMLKVTKAQIRDAARLYLRTDRYARFTLLPAEAEKKMVP